MIELKLFDKEEQTKTPENLVNDMFYGAAVGMGVALVTASAAAFYYAHNEGMTLPQCCSYVAAIDILLSKPILISGAAVGSIAGCLTYLVRKNM